jgi:RNA polymerase sigma-70 factor (ECF subfamily)
MTAATIEAAHGTHTLSDDRLMADLNAGEVEASLRALKERYEIRVHNLVHGIVRDSHLADDVTQEVFTKVFFKSHLYRPGSSFRAWLLEIARNQALSAIRARRRTPKPMGSLKIEDGCSSTSLLERLCGEYEDHSLQEREFMDLFSGAVDRLPERYRAVFQLCVREGRQYQEAARMLGISTGTVAVRIMRARKRLFDQLSHHMGRIRRPPACMQ